MMMRINEKLLQHIWKHQYFNPRELRVAEHGKLEILFPGFFNTNQGPDFLESRIRIDDTLLIGNIELHVLASDWNRHAHSDDPNYNNVILHVVWENDEPQDIKPMPTLVLQDRVSASLLGRFNEWMINTGFIPCASQVLHIGEDLWRIQKEALIIERLNRRTGEIKNMLERNQYHWEETFWWMIARNFGYSINANSFETIARSLPLSLLTRHRPIVVQLEAILFGQAGLLNREFDDEYAIMLQKEYWFYQKKYKLRSQAVPIHFLRMRPVNFPTIRLAQLAMLINTSVNLFSTIRNMDELKDVAKLFEVTANDYWHYHYTFDEPSVYQPKTLGKIMSNNILMNTVIPLLYAYGEINHEEGYKLKAVQWLSALPPEKNNIIHGFAGLNVGTSNAAESQALLELKSSYCDERKCLECMIGVAIIKNGG